VLGQEPETREGEMPKVGMLVNIESIQTYYLTTAAISLVSVTASGFADA
jgi:hypothetical protein